MKMIETEKKAVGRYAQVVQRIIGMKKVRKFSIHSKPLSVAIKPKNKEKFKSMEEAKAALQKAFCPGKHKVQIKRIVKMKEDIVVETDTAELMHQKL